ncbi:MAG TPA: UvrD-helicase domain-containing protein, partial [Phycisphaerales bacterium]|nr:UvrD-helicase domain-containing protein [Phycisphaerales bacterium]
MDAKTLQNPLFSGLTEPQTRGVATTEGPVLLLAAAGSGKTRVITRRIAYLLSLGVPPWQILALTFTNKAAGEMRERVARLLAPDDEADGAEASEKTGNSRAAWGERGGGGGRGGDGGEQAPARRELPRQLRGLTISTFHALCARLLRRYAPLMHGAEAAGNKVIPTHASQSGSMPPDTDDSRGDAPIANFPRGDYTIYDTDDQLALMKKVIAGLEINTSNFTPRGVLSTISAAKNELKDAAAFEREHRDFYGAMVARIYRAYERALRAANAVDFDDLMMLTVRLLKECAPAREEVQKRWKYLMIDEYQDTNHAQFLLSTMLVGRESSAGEDGGRQRGAEVVRGTGAEGDVGTDRSEQRSVAQRQPNICVVGDPDQSIYGWRGADISNILEFEAQYSGAVVIPLGENFRSTAPILAAADGLIRNNKRRKHKDLFTSRSGGEKVEMVLCADERHEAKVVVDYLKRWREDGRHQGSGTGHQSESESHASQSRSMPPGVEWKDMAIFYRNNALSRVVEDELRAEGIPYVIVRGTAFYQREEIKDALAYLRIAANPFDEVSLRRIVNKPARKIGASSLEAVEAYAISQELPLLEAMREAGGVAGVSSVAANAMAKFAAMIDSWRDEGTLGSQDDSATLAELVGRVIKESGLEAYYKAEQSKSESDIDRVANLEELVTSATEFEAEQNGSNAEENRDKQRNAEKDQEEDQNETDERWSPSRSSSPHPALSQREREREGARDPFDDPFGGLDGDEASREPRVMGILRAFLEKVSLVADADAHDPTRGAVTLMTLHAAKGLEFPC